MRKLLILLLVQLNFINAAQKLQMLQEQDFQELQGVINAAQESKQSEFYQPAPLQELALERASHQFYKIVDDAIMKKTNLNNLSPDQVKILQWGVNFEKPFQECIASNKLLEKALYYGNPQIVQYLLQTGANPHNGEFFHELYNNSHDEEIFHYLLDAGLDINKLDKAHNSPLFMAIRNRKNLDFISMLLKAGANVNQQNNSAQEAALHLAVRQRNIDVIPLLLTAGADVHQEDENGYSPINLAVMNGSRDIAAFLADSEKAK